MQVFERETGKPERDRGAMALTGLKGDSHRFKPLRTGASIGGNTVDLEARSEGRSVAKRKNFGSPYTNRAGYGVLSSDTI